MPTTEYVKIPVDRIGPLVGIKGKVKKEIEILTGTLLHVNSDDGTVIVSPAEDMENPFGVLNAVDIVKAIGKGFYPKIAITLNDDDIYLEDVDPSSYAESEEELNKQIAKVIGNKGIVVNRLSTMSGASIKIYNNEISLLGNFENVMAAKEAVVMLLNGSEHNFVYNFLKNKQNELEQDY